MAEENEQEKQGSTPEESLEVTLDKTRNRLILKDLKTGVVTNINASIVESDEEPERKKIVPLSAAEFRTALERVDALGLMWTADRLPRVIAKDEASEGAFLTDEYEQLQETYPGLPRELSAVVYHALTGTPAAEIVVGASKQELDQKVDAVRDLVLDHNFRSEFFFKYATKVPYFENIDWEVVLKTHERNVEGVPAVAYALLLLTFHNSNATVSTINEHQNITVAADLRLVNKLIRILVDVKTGLEQARGITEAISKADKGGNDDATSES